MAAKRILSLWFPRLAAERVLRRRGDVVPPALAIVADLNGAQVIQSVNDMAEAAGIAVGQGLRDATAICPGLHTASADPMGEAMFLTVLRRWAGKFSPWVAEEPPAGLMIDLTGCDHLFGGEGPLLEEVAADCQQLGLTFRAGIADTPGAAWALARYAGRGTQPVRNGDAIQQEARATRSRAAKRRGWERGGEVQPPAGVAVPGVAGTVIAPAGRLREAIADLPIAALRLPPETVAGLMRLGLRRVSDIAGMPRAALARRFGTETLRRLDQALGLQPEPVSPARADLHFAVRLTLPDPIGLRTDVEAALDRLLPALCTRLQARGRGARRVQLQVFRADGGVQAVEVGLARAAAVPDRIRPLLALKLDQIDAGFGIDCLRLSALATEALSPDQQRGVLEGAGGSVAGPAAALALDDLIGKLGARLGAEAVTRLHPSESHIPARSSITLTAAWSAPHAGAWPESGPESGPQSGPQSGSAGRWPLVMFRPEMVDAPDSPEPPARFRWRRRDLATRMAVGPERIQPEWWLDDPDWRSGTRDYWRIEVEGGTRLLLFYGQAGAVSESWYCEGCFV